MISTSKRDSHQWTTKDKLEQASQVRPSCKKLAAIYIIILSIGMATELASADSGRWTVGILGGVGEADRIANEIGCTNLGPVRGFEDIYVFERLANTTSKCNPSRKQDSHHVRRIKRSLEFHPSVAWVEAHKSRQWVKRDILTTRVKSEPVSISHRIAKSVSSARDMNEQLLSFNDELWSQQWYLRQNMSLHDQYYARVNLRVQEVWAMGLTGQGVVVSVLDDGLEWNHTDILPNYDPLASWDMYNNRSDPFPRPNKREPNYHGTRCAGEIAMVANNRKCGVGVAPRARIGAIKNLDGKPRDDVDAMSLIHQFDHIDIYSCSWGPNDDGYTVDGPQRLSSMALEGGTRSGRRGKGSLYVFANGNGGTHGDNCNCDGWVASIYTIAIGAVSQRGQMPIHGERCSSTLAVTCSDGAKFDQKIVSTDLNNKCTTEMDGSSAAAPLAAGILALVLEANNNITWRDAQHLIVASSNPLPLRDNPGWKRNAAGYLFNNRFGFGLMDAKAMVDTALRWQQVPQKSMCSVKPAHHQSPLFFRSREEVHVLFWTDGCQRELQNRNHWHQQQQQQQPAAVGRLALPANGRQHHNIDPQPTPVIYVEHVQVIVDIEYSSRGELDIFLMSPAGTVSTLLTRRPFDLSDRGFTKWPLMSVHFWGETSLGCWTLIVRDKNSQNNRGQVVNATLVLHGTSIRPAHMHRQRIYLGEDLVPPFMDPMSEFDEDDMYDFPGRFQQGDAFLFTDITSSPSS